MAQASLINYDLFIKGNLSTRQEMVLGCIVKNNKPMTSLKVAREINLDIHKVSNRLGELWRKGILYRSEATVYERDTKTYYHLFSLKPIRW